MCQTRSSLRWCAPPVQPGRADGPDPSWARQPRVAIGAQSEALETASKVELSRMKQMQAYIALRGGLNAMEMSDVPSEKMKIISQKMKPVLDWRVKRTKWCVLRWPSASMAQMAQMSTEAFEDFYFRVCSLDYSRMQPGMKALAELMMKTDRVQIKGPGTDLSFSIRGSKPSVWWNA
jgi:aminopeptidase